MYELPELENRRLASVDTPKVWASAALTTPSDDDVYDCTAGHDRGIGACYHCTDEKSEALDATSLVYYLVVSTPQGGNDYAFGGMTAYGSPRPKSANNSRQAYKLVKCGSREAAAAEAFYAAGANGWNVAFSCVMRHGETFDDRNGSVERVDELWKLSEDAEDDDTIRVFY